MNNNPPVHPGLQARKCTSQLIAGVLYLHNYSEQESIAHFDIKPDNVMSTIDGVLKVKSHFRATNDRTLCLAPSTYIVKIHGVPFAHCTFLLCRLQTLDWLWL